MGYVCISHPRKDIKSRCEYYGSRTAERMLRSPDKELTSFGSRITSFPLLSFCLWLPLLTHALQSHVRLSDFIRLFKYSLLSLPLSLSVFQHIEFPSSMTHFILKLFPHYSLCLYIRNVSLSETHISFDRLNALVSSCAFSHVARSYELSNISFQAIKINSAPIPSVTRNV